VLQAAGGPGLAVKSFQKIGALGYSGGDGFYRDSAANERIAPLEHDAHGPAADLLQDFVSANLLHQRRSHVGLVYLLRLAVFDGLRQGRSRGVKRSQLEAFDLMAACSSVLGPTRLCDPCGE